MRWARDIFAAAHPGNDPDRIVQLPGISLSQQGHPRFVAILLPSGPQYSVLRCIKNTEYVILQASEQIA